MSRRYGDVKGRWCGESCSEKCGQCRSWCPDWDCRNCARCEWWNHRPHCWCLHNVNFRCFPGCRWFCCCGSSIWPSRSSRAVAKRGVVGNHSCSGGHAHWHCAGRFLLGAGHPGAPGRDSGCFCGPYYCLAVGSDSDGRSKLESSHGHTGWSWRSCCF